jgi:putative ABC transport system substrate-binding protein
MRRREFLASAGALAAAFPGTVHAQRAQPARVGWLSAALAGSPENPLATLKETLDGLGWHIGQNLVFEERHANGEVSALPRLAFELVGLRPDVIGATGTTEAQSLQHATRDIPIVFMQVAVDPVRLGPVHSIARPGGNLTGFLQTPELLWGKRIDLLAALLGRHPQRLAFLGNPSNTSFALSWAHIHNEAARVGAEVVRADVEAAADLDGVFAKLVDRDALLVHFDFLLTGLRSEIAQRAARLRVPAIYEQRREVAAGGLLSYGPDLRDNYRQGAGYIDRVLRGARPAELPVVQGSRFELVLNLKAAKALGLAIPPSLLARADEVIE